MHDIRVAVMSPEEASHGVAELWLGPDLVAFTRFEDGQLVVHIEPRRDGGPVVLGASTFSRALAQAADALARF